MKAEIHPQYFEGATIRCSCGNIITAGSTRENLRTELCSKCHPFYTGQQKLVDTAGRVESFEARRKTAQLLKEAKKQTVLSKKLKTVKKGEEVRIEIEPGLAPEIGVREEVEEKKEVKKKTVVKKTKKETSPKAVQKKRVTKKK